MPAQRTLLIEKGVLKNFLSDRAGSLRTGHPRTGSGRRQNYTYAAASGCVTLILQLETTPLKICLPQLIKGIYCKKMGGGSVGATGQFHSVLKKPTSLKWQNHQTAQGSYLIGEAKEIMNKISMCSQDLALAAGFCGSISGSVYTTVGQPHIKVDSITVGGR
jgi:TldD protein